MDVWGHYRDISEGIIGMSLMGIMVISEHYWDVSGGIIGMSLGYIPMTGIFSLLYDSHK